MQARFSPTSHPVTLFVTDEDSTNISPRRYVYNPIHLASCFILHLERNARANRGGKNKPNRFTKQGMYRNTYNELALSHASSSPFEKDNKARRLTSLELTSQGERSSEETCNGRCLYFCSYVQTSTSQYIRALQTISSVRYKRPAYFHSFIYRL